MDDGHWYSMLGPPPRPSGRPGLAVIRPQLLVGEYPTPDDASWLRETHGVTAVVSLQEDADLASKGVDPAALERAYRMYALHYRRFPVPDGDDRHLMARLADIVAALTAFIDAGERVYLHCNAGFNRAPTAAIAYLHVREGLSLTAACEDVKARRPCVPYMQALLAHFRSQT